MSILRRKMFRGGGYAHRGTGITSGLTTPKRGYVDGPGSYQGIGESSLPSGVEDKWQAYYDMLKGVQGERAPFDRFDANVEPLMTMFGKWMSGKSYQPGLGGALEIAGEGLTEAAPGFGKAIREKRAYEAATGTEDAALRTKALELAMKEGNEKYDFKVVGKSLVRINRGTGQSEVVEKYEDEGPDIRTVKQGETLVEVTEEGVKQLFEKVKPPKEQQAIKLSPNQILIDPDTGEEIARGLSKQDTQMYRLNKGQKLFDAKGAVVAHYEDPDARIITLSPGQKAFHPVTKEVLFEVPPNAPREQTHKLSPGQIVVDAEGNTIASSPATEEDQFITVSPGSKVFNKETNELVFDNPTAAAQQKLVKVPPGTSLVDENGQVVYTAPQKDKYFTLKAGESVYDQAGNLIVTAPSLDDQATNYHDFKSYDERLLWKVGQYEKKAGFKNGKIDLDNLTDAERNDYLRSLQEVDKSAEVRAKSWAEFVADEYSNIPFVTAMDERIDQAKRLFEQAAATGPVRGRLAPVFGVFQDVTGINMAKLVNDVTGKDILTDPILSGEMERIRNEMGVQFQDVMKGQVSNFEQRMILNSFFSVLRLPESNEYAFQNMQYLNDLRKTTILIAESSSNYEEFSRKMEAWKKDNRPEMLKSIGDKNSELEEKYGIIIGDLPQ